MRGQEPVLVGLAVTAVLFLCCKFRQLIRSTGSNTPLLQNSDNSLSNSIGNTKVYYIIYMIKL